MLWRLILQKSLWKPHPKKISLWSIRYKTFRSDRKHYMYYRWGVQIFSNKTWRKSKDTFYPLLQLQERQWPFLCTDFTWSALVWDETGTSWTMSAALAWFYAQMKQSKEPRQHKGGKHAICEANGAMAGSRLWSWNKLVKQSENSQKAKF